MPRTQTDTPQRVGPISRSVPSAAGNSQRMGRPRNWKLNNRPLDIIHNHEGGQGHIVYAGYCPNAPMYHLFRCIALSPPPRRKVSLRAFDPSAFAPDSKAGRGGCSMPHCPSEATLMDKKPTHAYCDPCARRVREKLPCSWTSILPCNKVMGLDKGAHGTPCPTCRGFEEAEE